MKFDQEILEQPIVWIALVVIFLAWRFIGKEEQPAEKNFKCQRCRKEGEHNNRTIRAWQDGKKTFFCQACHLKWLDSKGLRDSPPPRYQGARNEPSTSSGCLSVVLLIISLSTIAITVLPRIMN
jgi:hypothetical protein